MRKPRIQQLTFPVLYLAFGLAVFGMFGYRAPLEG